MNKKIALLLIGVLMLTGCGGGEQAATAEPQTLIPVTYQMGWVHEYSSAGFYMAIENGYFVDEGLDLTLVEGGFGEEGFIDPMQQVTSGAADFSLASATGILQAREAGQPLVAIATVNQRSPVAILSLAETGITRPQDLEGHSLAIIEDSSVYIYDALFTAQNLDTEAINVIPRTGFGIEQLVSGEADSIAGWIINEGVELEENGYESNYILLSDYGIETYDLLLFTTEDMIANRPDVVERFLRATIRGHQAVIDDSDAAVDAVLSYNSELDRHGQAARLQAFIPIMNPAGTQIGMMNPDVWTFNYQLLVDNGQLSADVDLNSAYTMQFLDAIYSD